MTLTWGEYWLLETAVRAWTPLGFLVHPEIDQLFNKPGHNLTDHELLAVLLRLLELGDLVCRRGATGPFMPAPDEVEAALVCEPGVRPKNRLCYGLTEQGGRRWESAARPDWSLYVSNCFHTGAEREPTGERVRLGEIISVDRTRAEACVAGTERPVLSETVTWDRLEPWDVTYWKRLPVGHRVRFRYGPEEPLACGEAPRRSWHLDNSVWFKAPEFLQGRLFAIPLEDGRRGIVRVLETLTPEDSSAEPYRFVIACDWVGARLQIPSNRARLGRRFMGLSFGSWRNALLGYWVRGAIPASWTSLGTVEVTGDERRMARSTSSTGTWERAGSFMLREWRWRHDRPGDACQRRDEAAAGEARRQRKRTPEEREETEGRLERTLSNRAELRRLLVPLRAPEPPARLESWRQRVHLAKWTGHLEQAFRRLLARNGGAAGRLDRYEVRIGAPAPDGLTFDLVLGFKAGETYCCYEPGCHLVLSDGLVWDRLREILIEMRMLRPPLLTVRQLRGIVEPGSRFEVHRRLGLAEEVEDEVRYESKGQRESEALRSSPRLLEPEPR